jgi:hypothetical protein
MLMRKVMLTAICFLVGGSLNAQTLKNFAGTWRVDPSKSQEKVTPLEHPDPNAPDIPPPPPPPPNHTYSLEKIQESGGLLKISGGEVPTTAVYIIDPSGKEVSYATQPGIAKIATTRWDNGKLITEWKLLRNGQTLMHGTDVHSVTKDGQLIVTKLTETGRTRGEVRLLLNREP